VVHQGTARRGGLQHGQHDVLEAHVEEVQHQDLPLALLWAVLVQQLWHLLAVEALLLLLLAMPGGRKG